MDHRYGELEYPRLTWPGAGGWLTYLGTLVTLLLWVFPSTIQMPLAKKLAIAFLLFLASAMPIVAWHLVRVVLVAYNRAHQVDALVRDIELLHEKLVSAQQTINDLLQERRNRNVYSIDHCYTYEDQPFLALRKKPGAGVPVESKVTVIDTEIGGVMGYFRVIRQDNGFYLCRKDGYMDALWLGWMKKSGSQHSAASPTAVALIISTEDENG